MPFVSINPTTGETLAQYPALGAAEIESALATAHGAFAQWRHTPFAERALLMNRAAELLEGEIPVAAELMTREMGKTFAAAKGEAAKCAMTMRYYAEHAEALVAPESISTSGSRSGVRYEPTGVVFSVTPWNFPFWQVVRAAVPTIMAGNVVAFKHAPNVPGCALYLEDLFRRAGFASGVLTSLFVEVEQVESIIADARVSGVSLTGSERAGRSVAALAGTHLKKVVLELGGSDPFVVCGSADLERTVAGAVNARVQNNGQACIAAKRFIVVESVAEEFIRRFTEAMAAVTMGDPMNAGTTLGPLVSERQRDELDRQVRQSLAAGAVATTGGAPAEGPGFFYPATVLTNVPHSSPAGCEELFGPVAVVSVVPDLAAALREANDTVWGLGASVWAQDPAEIDAAIAGIDTGMVFANALVASMPELPFGGTKASGFGRELGAAGIREFLNAKAWYVS